MSYIDHICHTLLGSLGRKYPTQPATSQQPTSYNPYQPQTTPAYQPNNPAMSQNTPQPGVQQPGMDLNASHGSVVLCAYNCMIKTDSQFLKYTKYISTVFFKCLCRPFCQPQIAMFMYELLSHCQPFSINFVDIKIT